MFIFYPICGLANRMRVIESAYRFKCRFDKHVKVFWLKDSELNCDFEKIWQPLPFVSDTKCRLLSLFFKLHRRLPLFRVLLSFLKITRVLRVFNEKEDEALSEFLEGGGTGYLLVLACSWSSFYYSPESDKFFSELFKLRPDVADLLTRETAEFNADTVGVHIRRTDNVESIKNSPTELFIERMNEKIDTNGGTNFYLATDDVETKKVLKSIYQERIKIADGALSRDSEQGIIQAVIEMYTLSKTHEIIGSYYSSYSTMSSLLGNIPIEYATLLEQ